MKKMKYVFNEQTLRYEHVEVSLKERILKGLGLTASIIFTSLILTVILSHFFPTLQERALNREVGQMEFHLSALSHEYDGLHGEINKLQEKDAGIHRVIFGLDPIDESVWEGGRGGSENIIQLVNNRSANDILSDLLNKADKLRRKIEMQKASFDTILSLSVAHEKKLASIPSIKPVGENKLKRRIRYMSGYGWRIHPVHKVKKFHRGMDFTAPRGTAIQATGDGVIARVQNRRSGYGKNVIIDHGYGFETLFAHLQDVEVKVGQKVKKGQRIGTIGSSGTSTAPHLHYEIRLNDKAINPIDYVLDGLSPDEYQELLKQASEENQSLD